MTNEESTERYWIEIERDAVYVMFDGAVVTRGTFTGPDRLLAATAELNRLNAEQEAWDRPLPEPTTPADFLTKRLPEVARRQRIESHLAEVVEIEEGLVRVLAEDAANLKRATALREKLEKELASPLSATLPDENAPEVAQGTYEPYGVSEAFPYGRNFAYKPQPY